MLKFYQTSNLDGYLDQIFYDYSPDITKQNVDPFFSWYGDLFFLNRKKNIILCNELTKFCFFIFDYKRDKTQFNEVFCNYFSFALKGLNLNPRPYLDAVSQLGLNFKANKSIIAHMNRIQEEYIPHMKIYFPKLSYEEQHIFYNKVVNERPTTFKGKNGYIYPLELLREELEMRNLN